MKITGSYFFPLKEKKLRNIFDAGFELILPYLKRDLFSRSPCRIVRYDGTFSIAKVTMNDSSSEDLINCLVIIIGEFGHVMSWAYCNAEGSNLYQYLNQQLLKRCQMLDLHVDGIKPRSSLSHPNNPYLKRRPLSRVDAVEWSYSDTCCEGLKDPTKHWFPKVWPFATRAPLLDMFHAQKKVNESTRPNHELKKPFMSMLSQSCIKFVDSSKNHVLKHYKSKNETSSVSVNANNNTESIKNISADN